MTPDQRLWQDVAFRAIIDALSSLDINNEMERLERRAAREWMKGDTRDFFDVCTRAGLDPHFVREKFAAGKIRIEDIKTARHVRHAAE